MIRSPLGAARAIRRPKYEVREPAAKDQRFLSLDISMEASFLSVPPVGSGSYFHLYLLVH